MIFSGVFSMLNILNVMIRQHINWLVSLFIFMKLFFCLIQFDCFHDYHTLFNTDCIAKLFLSYKKWLSKESLTPFWKESL